MKMPVLVALPLLTIALTGCVVGGGLNYHFPASLRPPKHRNASPEQRIASGPPSGLGHKRFRRPHERAALASSPALIGILTAAATA